ncbi:MAG: hypothetical protein K5751_01775, partial [Treponemataceae bacterium]|nr:hypothetical protein [Treponemataceae bacterium]
MHFYSVSDFYKKIFGCKAYKIAIDAGCTCPTRDGTKGVGGCTFCSASGSGDFASSRKLSITEQIEDAKRLVGKKLLGGGGAEIGGSRVSGGFGAGGSSCVKNASGGTYIAYFQNFTNTYGDPDELEKKYLEACSAPNVSGISIATRPDCLSDDILRRIARIAEDKAVGGTENASGIKLERKFVQLELGLQTSDENTAAAFRRGFTNDVYVDAVRRIKAASSRIHVVTDRTIKVTKEHKVNQVILAGGVSANSYLREQMTLEMNKLGV